MKILCGICWDNYTGGSGESILSTFCGHVYHQSCLEEWMERNKSCPHCRSALTVSNVHKLNLIFEQERTSEEANSDNVQFQLNLKKEVQHIRETSEDMVLEIKQLKEYVKALGTERIEHGNVVNALENQIRASQPVPPNIIRLAYLLAQNGSRRG